MKMNLCSRFATSCLSAARLGRKHALALALLPFLASASAQSTWDGGGGDNNWTTAANWLGDVAPVASATTNLQFDGNTRLTADNNFAANSNFQNITFNSGAGAFTLTGNAITLNGTGAVDGTGAGVTNSSAVTQNVNLNLANASGFKAFVSTLAGGNLVLGGTLSGNGATVYSLNNSAGRSAITLNGNNTNSGSVFVYGQNQVNTVFLGNNAAFGSGAGTLNLGSSNKGVQLVAIGGARSIANAVSLSALTDFSFSVGGENDLTFNGLVSGPASSASQSFIALNSAGTTRFNGGFRNGVSNSSNVLSLAGDGNVEIAGNLSTNGTGSLWMIWNNSASLTLSGSNTHTGSTRLYGGNVILDYSTNDNNKLADGRALELAGTQLSLSGGSHTEVVSALSFYAGATSILRTSGSSTLALNAITRAGASGATMSFAEDSIATTDTLNSAGGILGTGWALVGDNWAMNSTNLADGAIVGLTSYAAAPIGNSVFNYLITASGTVSSTSNINSLKINAATPGQSLTNNAALSFRAGILMTGTNDYSIGGTGTLAIGGSDDDLKIYVNGSGNLTISSNIANRGAFATPLTKSGSGKLILSGTKTFTGAIFLNQGTLSVDSSGALGGGTTINLLGGTLEATESFTLTRSGGFVLGANGATISVASDKTLTLDGDLGNFSTTNQAADTTFGSLTKSGAGTLVTTDTNTYTGKTTIAAGVLSVSSIKDGAELLKGTYADGVTSAGSGIGASTSNYRNLVLNGGTLRYTGAATSSNRDFTIGANGGTLDASGSGALNLTGNDIFLSGSNTARSLTLAGSNTGTNTLTGALADNGTGKTSLVKTGTGQWVLTAANTYSGTTTVSAGTLLISNTEGSGAGTGNVVVNGGKIGGSGAFAGALAVNTGGTLSPGSSIETLGSGTLTFNTGSAFEYEVDSSVATSVGADLQKVTGGLNLNGTVTLTLADIANTPAAFAQTTTIFTLINYSGAWNNGLFTFGGNAIADGGIFTAGLNTWQLDYNATVGGVNFIGEYAGGNFVNMTAVPEPSTWALLGIGLMTTMFFRRRRTH